MDFTELYKSYVYSKTENSELSRNKLIDAAEIDRSTFYKNVKGKRIPTPEQYSSVMRCLIKKFGLTEDDESKIAELDRAYFNCVYDDMSYDDFLRSMDFTRWFGKLERQSEEPFSDKDYLFKTVKNKIVSEYIDGSRIGRRRKSAKSCVRVFLPLKDKYFKDDKAVELFGTINNPDVGIKHLIPYMDNDSMEVDDIRTLIQFLDGAECDYEAHSSGAGIKMSGMPYPYYVVTDTEVMLISDSLDVVRVTNIGDVKRFADEFDKIYDNCESVVTSFKDKEDMVLDMEKYSGYKTYFVQYYPGISYISDAELAKKYVPLPFRQPLLKHADIMKHLNYVEVISERGIRDFMKNGVVDEAGFRLCCDEETIKKAKDKMLKRIGYSLVIADDSLIPITSRFTMSVIAGEAALFVPNDRSDYILSVSDKQLVSQLIDFLDVLSESRYVLTAGESRKFLGGGCNSKVVICLVCFTTSHITKSAITSGTYMYSSVSL